MIHRHHGCLLALIGAIIAAAEGHAAPAPDREKPIMVAGPSFSRPPPAQVAPVEVGGVRVEQVMDTTGIVTEDHSGWLRATAMSDGTVLWTRQIYTSDADSRMEGGLQRVFLRSMAVAPDGEAIVIENEAGGRYRVDPQTGESTKIE